LKAISLAVKRSCFI